MQKQKPNQKQNKAQSGPQCTKWYIKIIDAPCKMELILHRRKIKLPLIQCINPNFAKPKHYSMTMIASATAGAALLVPRTFFFGCCCRSSTLVLFWGQWKMYVKIWIKWSVNAIERHSFFFNECIWFGQVNDDDDQRANGKKSIFYII